MRIAFASRPTLQGDLTPPTAARRPRSARTAFYFVLPFFALFFMFSIAPLLYSAYLSLFTEKASGLGFGGGQNQFVGLQNFARALADPAFLDGFVNVAVYCIVYIPVMVAIAILIALLLDAGLTRWKAFFQLSFYMPHIVPGLIAAIIWLYLYTPGISPIQQVWSSLGGSWDLSSNVAAYLTLSNLAIWLNTGYNVIIFYAALQSVPRDVVEAASIDGAGSIRIALTIKTRMIFGAVTVATLFTLVGALQLFAEPYLLSERVPSIDSTWTPNMFVFQTAFERSDFGYAAASALLFALCIGALSWVFTRISGKVAQ